jgi:hypothetical protein
VAISIWFFDEIIAAEGDFEVAIQLAMFWDGYVNHFQARNAVFGIVLEWVSHAGIYNASRGKDSVQVYVVRDVHVGGSRGFKSHVEAPSTRFSTYAMDQY